MFGENKPPSLERVLINDYQYTLYTGSESYSTITTPYSTDTTITESTNTTSSPTATISSSTTTPATNPMGECPYPSDGGGMPQVPKEEKASSFTAESYDDDALQQKFIKKVFLTVTVQLLFTTVVVCIFTFVPATQSVFQQNVWLYYISYAVVLVIYVVLVACKKLRREWPKNIICLCAFTIATTFMASAVAAFHATVAVLIFLIIAILLSFSFVLFAICWDFDWLPGMLLAILVTLFLTGLACMICYFIGGTELVLQAVYAGGAALFFGIIFVVSMMGILEEDDIEEEEYIYGALEVYSEAVEELIDKIKELAE